MGDLEAGKRKARMSQVSRKHPGEGGRPRAGCHAVLGLHLPCCVPHPSYRFTEAAQEKKTSVFFSFSRVSRPGCNSSFLIYCLTARPRCRGGVEPQGIFPEAAAQEWKALGGRQPHAKCKVRVPTSGLSKSHECLPVDGRLLASRGPGGEALCQLSTGSPLFSGWSVGGNRS